MTMAIARCESFGSFRDIWSALEADYGDRTWLIVIDRNLLRANDGVLRGLGRRRRRGLVDLVGGERVKTLRRIDDLARGAREVGLARDGLVVAVGGGTVGDLAGFFASMWMRGVDWIPVATTTLSIADSAVGGKTAVDWAGLKNQLGAFHDPVRVLAVEEALRTLPMRHYRAGLAEVAKSAVIADARLFGILEKEAEALRKGRSERVLELLGRASAIKARIVARDPREQGVRAWLNFGHTVGHALESTCRPRLYHGEAVAAGMIAASWLSECLIAAPSGMTDRIVELLRRMGTLRTLSSLDDGALRAAMAADKKSRRGRLRVVLTPRIGVATVADLPPAAMMREAVQQMQRRCTPRRGE